jgi:hypothetical protein
MRGFLFIRWHVSENGNAVNKAISLEDKLNMSKRTGVFITKRKHLLTRLPLVMLLILIFALSPFLIGISGAWISELTSGIPCNNEGNCFWLVLPWLGMITFPIGVILFIALLIITMIDFLSLVNRKTN